MAPFSFPDPQVQNSVVHPDTGDLWVFLDGVWMISDPEDPEGAIYPCTDVDPIVVDNNCDSDEITLLRAEIQTLRNDIIELKAELQAASINNFLILE